MVRLRVAAFDVQRNADGVQVSTNAGDCQGGWCLVESTAPHSRPGVRGNEEEVTEAEVRRHLAQIYRNPTDEWQVVARHEILDAYPATPPLITRRDVDFGDGLFVAGDHRDTASIQGAVVSCRRLANAVRDYLGEVDSGDGDERDLDHPTVSEVDDSARRHILLISSSGGVLLDLLALEPWWCRHHPSWVLVRAIDTESLAARFPSNDVRWAAEESARAPLGLIGAVRSARSHLRRERPDVIVSAGTGVAIAYFIAARSLRIPTLWVETLNLIDEPGLAARLCGHLADRVLVQRPELLATRRRAVLLGELY